MVVQLPVTTKFCVVDETATVAVVTVVVAFVAVSEVVVEQRRLRHVVLAWEPEVVDEEGSPGMNEAVHNHNQSN